MKKPIKTVTRKQEKPPSPAVTTLAKKTVNQIGKSSDTESEAWGSEDISNEDLLLPKILLMQPMSVLVTEGIAKIGEFRGSLEKDLLGSDKEPVELIIFGSFKTWLEFKDGEYHRTVRMDGTNIDWALEEVLEDGEILTRDKVLNFYCLRPSDIDGGEAFPFVLSCRRTSYQTGKKLSTHIKKLSMFKKPAASKIFSLTSHKETNDKGTFFVTDVDVLGDASDEQIAVAYEWYKLLAKAKVKVDDQDLQKESIDNIDSTSDEATEAAPLN